LIETIAIALMACAALIYVMSPLGRKSGKLENETTRQVVEAGDKKRAALTALVDLEMERDLGKLSEPDFNELRNAYESEALAALKEIDLISLPPDDQLELEIAALRSQLECPACGALRENEVTCPRCGAG
jgi:hypothetical protein